MDADGRARGDVPAGTAGPKRSRQQIEVKRREKRLERRLEDDDLVEGQHPGERREGRRQPRGALAEPLPRRRVHEADGHRAEHNLRGADDDQRPAGHGEPDRDEVDVERRDVVPAGAEQQVARRDPPAQLQVHRGVETAEGLEERMIVELDEDNQLREEGGAEERPEPPARPGGGRPRGRRRFR